MIEIQYDPEVDALSISLNKNEIKHTTDLDSGCYVDYDAAGKVCGMELLKVTTRCDGANLAIKGFADGAIQKD